MHSILEELYLEVRTQIKPCASKNILPDVRKEAEKSELLKYKEQFKF